jgi:hypothetical protein
VPHGDSIGLRVLLPCAWRTAGSRCRGQCRASRMALVPMLWHEMSRRQFHTDRASADATSVACKVGAVGGPELEVGEPIHQDSAGQGIQQVEARGILLHLLDCRQVPDRARMVRRDAAIGLASARGASH